MQNASRYIRSTLTPLISAASRSCAAARISRPSSVDRRNQYSPRQSAIETALAISAAAWMNTLPTRTICPDSTEGMV